MSHFKQLKTVQPNIMKLHFILYIIDLIWTNKWRLIFLKEPVREVEMTL
jgi:hypothetical protein